MESSPFSHALSILFTFCFLTLFMSSTQATRPIVTTHPNNTMDYIKESCNTTLYPSLCYKSISKYSSKIKTNPKTLATTSLSITLSSTQSSLESTKNLSKNHALNLRETSALSDCLEVLSDSVNLLEESIEEMDHIELGPEFEYEISNVQTWASAALTNDDTCMDGFDGYGIRDDVKAMVGRRVSNALQMTSISLTFINDYAKS